MNRLVMHIRKEKNWQFVLEIEEYISIEIRKQKTTRLDITGEAFVGAYTSKISNIYLAYSDPYSIHAFSIFDTIRSQEYVRIDRTSFKLWNV